MIRMSQKRAVILLISSVMGLTQSFAQDYALAKGDVSAVAFLTDEYLAKAVAKADSLFTARQYTQAFDLYENVFRTKHHSPAILLKMAFIQEGLGRLGESLYYLNLYYLASGDPQALVKMEELAEKNRLEGYESNPATQVYAWLHDHYLTLTGSLIALTVLLLALLAVNRKRRKSSPSLVLASLTITLALLFLQINFSAETRHGIVTQAPTYLMSGPSSGARVVAIIGEGHQLRITGRKDVWLEVEWRDQPVFVRDYLVRQVSL